MEAHSLAGGGAREREADDPETPGKVVAFAEAAIAAEQAGPVGIGCASSLPSINPNGRRGLLPILAPGASAV
jgi:hypothetical protein